MSTDTYAKGKKIPDSNNETLKQEVLSGEKSINTGYKELTQDQNEELSAKADIYSTAVILNFMWIRLFIVDNNERER